MSTLAPPLERAPSFRDLLHVGTPRAESGLVRIVFLRDNLAGKDVSNLPRDPLRLGQAPQEVLLKLLEPQNPEHLVVERLGILPHGEGKKPDYGGSHKARHAKPPEGLGLEAVVEGLGPRAWERDNDRTGQGSEGWASSVEYADSVDTNRGGGLVRVALRAPSARHSGDRLVHMVS